MLLIQNVLIADPKSMTERLGDIFIKDGKISEICAPNTITITDNMDVIDGTDLVAGPGLVDIHVHFRDPGLTYKEDIHTGALAAAAGGFTTVVMMANTKPVIDSIETLSYVIKKGKETPIHVESCASVTVGMQGEMLVDMDALKEAGAIGFTDDGVPLLDAKISLSAMKETARLNVPLSFHEEDSAYIQNNGINHGEASKHFGIGGSDRRAESSIIARDIDLALETGAHINVQHISSKEGVALIREAKVKGANVYAEATPHHIALTEEAAIEKGTLAKMNPPLRAEEDRQAIIEAIKDGTIDFIATDHAPHSIEEKSRAITEAPSGIIGLETSLALCITHLVEKGHLNYAELMAKMSYNPAKYYHLDKERGHISVGANADLVLFAPKKQWVVPNTFASKAVNTPFIGETLMGQVQYTICNGNIVYKR